MALTHATATRTALANAILSLANGGDLVILDGSTVLTTHELAGTAGTVTNGVLTYGAIGDGTVASGGGTPDNFEVRTSGGAVVYEGTVGGTGSGADLEFASTTWAAGGTVSISGGTYTAPA